jgi:Cof subfamily protein (haloacid dehalogenase superfamily)
VPRIKLMAFDLDGTLLAADKHVPERNRRALRAAASRGVQIVLASGRMTACIEPFAREIGLDCIIVAYNGAMARGRACDGRRVLHHCPLPVERGRELVEYCRDRYLLNYYIDDELYAQDRPELRRWAGIYAERTGATYHFVPDLAPLADRASAKAIIITSPPERERLYGEWVARWPGRATIVRTDPEYLEFVNKDTNKGVALASVAAGLGTALDEVMAMGDGDNDAEMLATAGLGLAVANATALAKESADVVLGLSHQDCAVAEAVDRYVLRDGA